jgi:Mrp family chromosome partitioning ATPase
MMQRQNATAANKVMSKNFELMQEEQRETGRATAPDSGPPAVLFARPELVRTPNRGAHEFDRVAQEECLKLVQRIFLGAPADVRHSVVFAGIDRGAGCSRICLEAARILASNVSGPICLVDANFRQPSLPGFFDVSDDRGLADALLSQGGIRSFTKQLTPSNLWILSAGDLAPESPGLLNSESLKLRLQELRNEFDYVLIDSPALNLYSDAIALGRMADGVVVVLQADSTRRESALKGLQSLRDAQIEVLGAVLNRRTFPIPDFVYRRL